MKDEDVSTLDMASQDWEMVAEMVVETENAATSFMQGSHVPDIKAPAFDLQDSLKTMERLSLGSTGGGVEVPSCHHAVTRTSTLF